VDEGSRLSVAVCSLSGLAIVGCMTISFSSALAFDPALECVLRLAFIVAVAHIGPTLQGSRINL
jgi:hypothetical protein